MTHRWIVHDIKHSPDRWAKAGLPHSLLDRINWGLRHEIGPSGDDVWIVYVDDTKHDLSPEEFERVRQVIEGA